MKNAQQTWLIYNQAKVFGKTPAALLGLTDSWVAWQFNETVYMLGAFVEARLEERTKKHKPRWTLEAVLAGRAKRPVRGATTTGKASVAALRAAFGSAVGPTK